MRTLTVKMEEIESTAISTSRVTIKKMETRIEELEVLYDREKKMHVETMSALHKKDRSDRSHAFLLWVFHLVDIGG